MVLCAATQEGWKRSHPQAPTTEEALHHIAGGKLHSCLPGVSGQSGVSTIGEEKPHGFQVVIGYCVMDRPVRTGVLAERERKRGIAKNLFWDKTDLVMTTSSSQKVML